MNLQGFINQPQINGRQARWLIYLTPYDFIIRHRPGALNPADGPSRRPDFLGQAQAIPRLVQTDLLASKLVGAGSDLSETARPSSKLCNIARCQLCEVARVIPEFKWHNTTKPKLCDLARPELFELLKAVLCDAAKATRRVNASSPLVDSKGQ